MKVTQEEIDEAGKVTKTTVEDEEVITDSPEDEKGKINEPPPVEHRKFYYDGGQVEIAAHLGAQPDRSRRHCLCQRLQASGRLLVLLQSDQRGGGAVIGRVCAAALVPALRQVARFPRVLPRQPHTTLIGRRLGCRVARRGRLR